MTASTRKRVKHNGKTRRRCKKNKETMEEECNKINPQQDVLFEDKLEKTAEYKSATKMKNLEKALIKRFKTPFSPSSITPNNDFYTYINYRWLKDTAKKSEYAPEKEKYFVQVDDTRVAQNRIYVQLIDYVKEFIQTKSTPEAQAIKKVYTSLLNLNSDSIKKHIRNLECRYDEHIQENNLWKFLAHINTNEIVSWACPISWSVDTDEKDSTHFKNQIMFPELGLYDYLMYFDNLPDEKPENIHYRRKVKHAYLEYIQNIFDACLGKNHHLKAKDVFDVEYDILIAMGCESIKNDSPDFYNIVKKEDALPLYGFDWDQFSYYLGYAKTPDTFICGSLNYLKCICTELNKNWTTPKWKSFWFFLYLKQFIRFDAKLRPIFYEFNGKFLRGQPAIFPRDIYPVFGLSFTFNTFLTQQYVNRNENKRNIHYVENMAKDLVTVYKRIIKRNTWMSSKTKRFALKKLEHLKFVIARPEDLREDPLLNYTDDDAWGNMLLLAEWKTRKYVELNNKALIDIPIFDWNAFKLAGTQAYVANAYYTPTLNSIYVPLGYLLEPFVNLNDRGLEYNLSHIGYTLCHEMSHALDESGSKYDHNGNLHDWWTKEDKIKYKRIIRDIIKQYEVYASYDGIDFDAANSIGEDMADISGLAICEEYLRDFHMNSNSIVPIVSLSFQEFFIYFALQNRQHVYKKAVAAQLKTNPHPMDKYRTNVPLSRLELFRSLYNVKKGDKMWWPSTSTIW